MTAETTDLATPRPWYFDNVVGVIRSGPEPNGAYLWPQLVARAATEDMAQQIIREHNSHDALVAACEAALGAMPVHCTFCARGVAFCDARRGCVGQQMREALRLARGGAA